MRGFHPVPAPTLRQARWNLVNNGQCAELPGMDERVLRSWQRSLQAGLLPTGRLHVPDPLHGKALGHVHEQHRELMNHSQPVMEVLFEQVRHSHSMVILANADGVLMHTLGDLDFLTRAERVALSCGTSWHESQRGTNAIGTALAEASEVEIHGGEHYLERNGFLTCAASPILSARGELMGILDISGDQRGRHPHTLGLVSTAARMIENRLLVANHPHQLVLHLHAKPEGLATVAEGLVVVTVDGWITGANRAALRMLSLSPRDLGGVALSDLLDVTLDELMRRASSSSAEPKFLRGVRGQFLACKVEWQHRDRTLAVHQTQSVTLSPQGTDFSAHASAQPPAQTGVATDAFVALDTGDARVKAVVEKARRVAGKPIAVLLQGESGVGKEWLAKAIHQSSERRHSPFVAINCAAIPEHLIEAELFGYAPGAFTGASKNGSLGLMREAHGGTLFLDEIGDMPLHLQSRLLRVLQDKKITPVGAQQAVSVDFALICASHKHLKQAADEGKFRLDLFYRINGLSLVLPPLRDRSDLPALVARMLKQIEPSRQIELSSEVKAAFQRHPWPGNLRQLHSVLQTATALLNAHEQTIDSSLLPDDWLAELPSNPAPTAQSHGLSQPIDQTLHAISWQVIQQTLQAHRGNVSAAARALGISRQTLYRKLQALAH